MVCWSCIVAFEHCLWNNQFRREAEINSGPCLPEQFVSFSAVKELLGRGLWSAFNQIGNLLNTGLDLWVTNLMLDALKMGQLSIVKTVASMCSALPPLITQPFQPTLLKLYADKNKVGVRDTIIFQMKLLGILSGVILAGFSVLGKSYFELWTPTMIVVS